MRRAFGQAALGADGLQGRALGAVSYTHLDVYKRQAFGVEKIVNGVAGMVPGNSLFLISGLVTLLALLPLFPAARMEKARAGAAAQP